MSHAHTTPGMSPRERPLGDARLRWVIVLFVAAAGVRLTWVGARYGRDRAWSHLEYPDEEAYLLSARSLASGRGLVDEFGYRATYMPGYPAFLSLFVKLGRGVFWARVVQALLAAWVAPATFLLARAFVRIVSPEPDAASGGSRRGWGAHLRAWVPLVAGALAAMDPFLVFFSGLLLTEALFASILVSAWAVLMCMADRHRPVRMAHVIGGGALLYGAVMLRPSAFILVLAAGGALLAIRRFAASAWLAGVGIFAVVGLGLAPWAARNRSTIGEWRWLTTRGGISLYDGVRPGAIGGSDLAHTKVVSAALGLSETGWDDYWRGQARAAIRAEPARIVCLAGDKFLRTWSLRPNVATYHTGPAARVSAAWMSVLLIGAVAGWYACRRSIDAWFFLLLPVLMTTLLHMIFVGSVRYRVPVMPMLMVLATAALLGPFGRAARPARADQETRLPTAAHGSE